MSEAEFLTIPEVAKVLRVAVRTAYSLAREQRLPAIKVGTQWRISRAALETWATEGRLPHPEETATREETEWKQP